MFDSEALTYTVVITDSDDDPVSHSRVMASFDANLWLDAMDTEIHSMYGRGVWALVDPPKWMKPIGLSWIYLKSGLYGNVETFRMRLVAMGYTLKEGAILRCDLLSSCHACDHSDPLVQSYYIDL